MNFINLLVEGINQEGNRIVIKSGGKSYSFFVTKQDGTQSRAYQDYMKGVQIGKTYSFGVTETIGKAQDGRDITYRNIGVISEARDNQTATVSSNLSTTAPLQTQVIPTQPQGQNYQTMSDFELKMIAEMKQFRAIQDKMFNMLSNIVIGLGDKLNDNAMEIHAMDNHSANLENVGLKEKSNLEDITMEDVPF